MFDFDEYQTPPAFPDALLEPPPEWGAVGLFEAESFVCVSEEVSYRSGSSEDDLTPERQLRRYELHSVVGEHAIYVHCSGRLFQPNAVAVVIAPRDVLVIDEDPDMTIPMFTRVVDAWGLGETEDAAVAAVVAKLQVVRSVARRRTNPPVCG